MKVNLLYAPMRRSTRIFQPVSSSVSRTSAANGKLAAVDPAARQLVFGFRFALVGEKHLPIPRDDRIHSLPFPVSDRAANGFIETGDHAMSWAAAV